MSDIPTSLKSRIAKLLALANDGRGNENEAAVASAKVQALLAEYNLELSQIVETPETVDPEAVRAKHDDALTATFDWQAKLLDRIASNNFVMKVANWRDIDANVRSYSLIGRRVNVVTTIQVYNYLTAAIERLCPFADRRTKAHRSWKDGCADRLRERLWEQRAESERASKTTPRGDGSSLVLSDVYSTEDDLNIDLYYGYEPGTTARERAEREARWARELEERRNAPVVAEPVRIETEAQRRKREAKEKAESDRYWKRYERDQARAAAKVDRDAYAMGANAGSQISLDRQIGGLDRTARLA